MLKQFIPTGLQQFSFYSKNKKLNQNLFRFSVNKKKETKYCKFRLIKKKYSERFEYHHIINLSYI